MDMRRVSQTVVSQDYQGANIFATLTVIVSSSPYSEASSTRSAILVPPGVACLHVG